MRPSAAHRTAARRIATGAIAAGAVLGFLGASAGTADAAKPEELFTGQWQNRPSAAPAGGGPAGSRTKCVAEEVSSTYNQLNLKHDRGRGAVSVTAPSTVRWAITVGH